MIVYENLNDCSELLIDKLNKKLKISDKVTIVSAILCAIFWFVFLFMFVKYHQEKSKNEFLEGKIQQEEQMLSLEYSIGYWFINLSVNYVIPSFLRGEGISFPSFQALPSSFRA
jgi:hypothetical protein